jgi:hypothetical protein
LEIESEPLREYDQLGQLASELLGPPAQPHKVSDLPLFGVIYWVATEGGEKDFNVIEQAVWDVAILAVLEKVRSGELRVTGRRFEGDFPELVPHFVFCGIQIEHPYLSDISSAEAALSREPTLRLSVLGGLGGDQLVSGAWLTVWQDLRISGREAAELWPFKVGRRVRDLDLLVNLDDEHTRWKQRQRLEAKLRKSKKRATPGQDKIAPVLMKYGWHEGPRGKAIADIARKIEKELDMPKMADPLRAICRRIERYYDRHNISY